MIKEAGLLDMISPYKNDEEIYKAAAHIVKGKVVSSHYTLDGSSVYTASEVLIEKAYKGDLKVGDKIIRPIFGIIYNVI